MKKRSGDALLAVGEEEHVVLLDLAHPRPQVRAQHEPDPIHLQPRTVNSLQART